MKKSLARRLLVYVLLFSSLITCVVTIFQLYLDYSQDLQSIDATFEQVKKSFLPSLEKCLWAADEELLQTQIQGIFALPNVHSVEVVLSSNRKIFVGKKNPRYIVSKNYSLFYKYRQRTIFLAKVKICSDLNVVYTKLLNKAWIILFSQGVKTFLVSLFILLLFYYLVTRHLIAMSFYSQKLDMAKLGEPLTLNRPRCNDELEEVVLAFNQMCNNLQNSYQELQHELQKRKQTEQKIALHANQMEELVKEKTKDLVVAQEELVNKEKLAALGQLTATIAHELRNPLGAIRNSCFFIRRKTNLENQILYKHIKIIEEEVVASDAIIRNLLEATRTKEPNKQNVNLKDIVEEIFARKNIPQNIVCECVLEKPFIVYADPIQLKQVLDNLLDNSFDALASGGKITILAERAKDMDIIYFLDSGKGIPKENRKQIFEPLYTTKVKGTGLGLWVSRQIMRKHNGDITLDENEAKTVFNIKLPIGL